MLEMPLLGYGYFSFIAYWMASAFPRSGSPRLLNLRYCRQFDPEIPPPKMTFDSLHLFPFDLMSFGSWKCTSASSISDLKIYLTPSCDRIAIGLRFLGSFKAKERYGATGNNFCIFVYFECRRHPFPYPSSLAWKCKLPPFRNTPSSSPQV